MLRYMFGLGMGDGGDVVEGLLGGGFRVCCLPVVRIRLHVRLKLWDSCIAKFNVVGILLSGIGSKRPAVSDQSQQCSTTKADLQKLNNNALQVSHLGSICRRELVMAISVFRRQ